MAWRRWRSCAAPFAAAAAAAPLAPLELTICLMSIIESVDVDLPMSGRGVCEGNIKILCHLDHAFVRLCKSDLRIWYFVLNWCYVSGSNPFVGSLQWSRGNLLVRIDKVIHGLGLNSCVEKA